MQAIHRKTRKPAQLILCDAKTRFDHHLIMDCRLQEPLEEACPPLTESIRFGPITRRKMGRHGGRPSHERTCYDCSREHEDEKNCKPLWKRLAGANPACGHKPALQLLPDAHYQRIGLSCLSNAICAGDDLYFADWHITPGHLFNVVDPVEVRGVAGTLPCCSVPFAARKIRSKSFCNPDPAGSVHTCVALMVWFAAATVTVRASSSPVSKCFPSPSSQNFT